MILSFWQPTPHSRELAAVIRRALQTLALSPKEIAAYTGQGVNYVKDQLACRRPLSVWRFFLVPGFRRALLDTLAADEDCIVFDRQLVQLIVRVDEKRPVLKVTRLADTPPERKRA